MRSCGFGGPAEGEDVLAARRAEREVDLVAGAQAECEAEQAKLSSMLRQNVVMQQMYDCNGTGRRGKPSNDPEYMGGGMVA